MAYKLGIDVGGTFTDVCLFEEETGAIHIYKSPSTPKDPAEGIANAITEILRLHSVVAEEIVYLVHGTTVATNAATERKGAPTGLITTQGFRDLLELARQMRPELYNLMADKPQPLVPRFLRKEVKERLKYDGSVLVALDQASVVKAIDELRAAGVQAIAVCLLHSYINPVHEKAIKVAIQERFPEAHVSISCEVLPEFREYERLTTTVLNAYLGPKVSQYMNKFDERVKQLGIHAAPHINQSNGGVMSIAAACDSSIRTALSGPSAGVIGGAYVASLAGYDDIVTFDMGGTSTDVSLIEKGRPRTSTDKKIAGFPVRLAMTDVNAVGAGGGSIAWVDSGGGLKVGPGSAGAEPGPACYGKGGSHPTVTDANVVLGRLNQQSILAGRIKLYIDAAHGAISKRIASPMEMSTIDAAKSILKIVVSNMVRAIHVISVERGYDPRNFALVAFGGAGPLHAVDVARELGIKKILIPESPGILCAMGLLMSDIRADYARTRILDNKPENLSTIQEIFSKLEGEAEQWLIREGVPAERRMCQRFVDMRYEGQNYELAVAVAGKIRSARDLLLLTESLNAQHQKTYGYKNDQAAVQMVNFRVTAIGSVSKATVRRDRKSQSNSPCAQIGERTVFFSEHDQEIPTPVYGRNLLIAGNKLVGPCIVEQMDSTTLVPPGYCGELDAYRNIIITGVGEQR